MAKVLKFRAFKTVIRVNRIDAVDRCKSDDGKEVVRVFMSGMEAGYTLNFDTDETLADKIYEAIVKAIEED